PTGHLFTIYVLGYALGRLWVESLRSDSASLILGLRVNIWMSLVVGIAAVVVLLLALRRQAPANAGVGAAGSDEDLKAEPGDGEFPGGDGADSAGRDGADDSSGRDGGGSPGGDGGDESPGGERADDSPGRD